MVTWRYDRCPTRPREGCLPMLYRQITFAERYTLGLLRQRGLRPAAIARVLGRHRSTIGREVRRNQAHSDGTYRPPLADWYARGRRSRSRRNRQFTAAQWQQIQGLLREDWSPEQVAGWLRRHQLLAISHETIYRYIWTDKRAGGTLYQHLRGARKQRRKRYGRYDSRGRLAGKRPISARPAAVQTRRELGHWDPGTNENPNALPRQYLPKRQSMAHLTQHDCNRIAAKLNRRPRKRLGYRTPEECYAR